MGKEILMLARLKDIRRILTNKNEITLYYKVDENIVPVFEITREIRGRKAQFKMYSHIDIKFALQEKYLKWYSNNVHDFKANSVIGNRKEIYARINFTKNVYIKFTEDDFIVGLDNKFTDLLEALKPINVDKLPYDKYYKSNYNSINGSDIKWTRVLYIKCIWTCFENFGINFNSVDDTFTWWYMGYTLTTKIVSFGWLGIGTCYRPTTSISNKKLNSKLSQSKHLSNWIHNSILDPINVINLFHNIGEFSDYEKLVDYNIAKFATESFIELSGNDTYYPDSCWESDKEKKEYQARGFKLFSDKPNFEDICLRLEIMFGIDVKKRLIELGFDKIIIGYFSYLDFYGHPIKHSSVTSWGFVNPFVLDLESGIVTYEILRNNETLPYSEAKIHEGKVLVTKNVPSSSRYGYILDLF